VHQVGLLFDSTGSYSTDYVVMTVGGSRHNNRSETVYGAPENVRPSPEF
jgi:hypothetical protein